MGVCESFVGVCESLIVGVCESLIVGVCESLSETFRNLEKPSEWVRESGSFFSETLRVGVCESLIDTVRFCV